MSITPLPQASQKNSTISQVSPCFGCLLSVSSLSPFQLLFSPAHIHINVRCVCFFLFSLPQMIATTQRDKAELWEGRRNFAITSTGNSWNLPSQFLLLTVHQLQSPEMNFSSSKHTDNHPEGKTKQNKKTLKKSKTQKAWVLGLSFCLSFSNSIKAQLIKDLPAFVAVSPKDGLHNPLRDIGLNPLFL